MNQDMNNELKKIGKKEFGHIKDPIDRHMAVMDAAIQEYIQNHRID